MESKNRNKKFDIANNRVPNNKRYFFLYLSPISPDTGVTSKVLIPAIDITKPISNSAPPKDIILIGRIRKAWYA